MIKLKNTEDISALRDSGLILAETHMKLKEMIQPGVTPLELDRFARDYVEKRGARPAFLNYNGFPASLCVSVNHVVIHGIPDSTPLKEGDIVSLDMGVDLGGYISDSAYTHGVGKIADEIQKLMKVTAESLQLAIDAAVFGNRIKDISHAVFNHAKAHGYGVVREYCGHGVGFDVHEEPQVPNYPSRGLNPRLKPGMVLAIEPMINLGTDDVYLLDDDWSVVTADQSVSAHFEHTVAVLKDKTVILTMPE